MIRSPAVRVPLFIAVALLVPPHPATPSRPLPRLSFRGAFDGVASGERSVWQGRVDGSVTGRVTIALRQVEEPTEASRPVWHVAARWTVLDDGGAHSFAANLEGIIDWKSGVLHLGGTISDGWSAGSWVEASGHLVDGDVSGAVTLTPPRSRE